MTRRRGSTHYSQSSFALWNSAASSFWRVNEWSKKQHRGVVTYRPLLGRVSSQWPKAIPPLAFYILFSYVFFSTRGNTGLTAMFGPFCIWVLFVPLASMWPDKPDPRAEMHGVLTLSWRVELLRFLGFMFLSFVGTILLPWQGNLMLICSLYLIYRLYRYQLMFDAQIEGYAQNAEASSLERYFTPLEWPFTAQKMNLIRDPMDDVPPEVSATEDANGMLTLKIRPLPGQPIAALATLTPNLRSLTDCEWVQCIPSNREVTYLLSREEPQSPLTQVIEWSPKYQANTIDSLLLGFDRESQPVRAQLFEAHTLIAAGTGGGKSNLMWSMLAQIAGRDDVQVWGIDLKVAEVNMNRSQFKRVATNIEDAVQLLYDAVFDLRQRLDALAEVGMRRIEPAPEMPLRIILIDEAAELWGNIQNLPPKERKEAISLLESVLRMGRSAGYVCIAAVQNPRKEAFGLVSMFTQRVQLRANSKQDQVIFLGNECPYDASNYSNRPGDPNRGRGIFHDADRGVWAEFKTVYVSDDEIRRLPAPRA